MANPNANCSNGPTKPANIVCIYHKDIKDKMDVSLSEVSSSNTLISYYEMVRGYKLCCLSMAEETYDFYRDIDNYELYDMQKSTEIIQTNVEAYIKKNGDLAKSIKEGSKMLNELKVKLHDANNAACAMSNCLKSILAFPDGAIPKEITAVTQVAKTLSEDGQKAAEALVKIAGIHTFSNVDGLKSFSQKLAEAMKQFKTLSDDYMKKAAEDAKTAQTELTKSVDELNKTEFKCFGETSALNANNATITFICNDDECCPIERVEAICKAVSRKPEGEEVQGSKPGGKYADGDRN
ncbi:MAG: hypothetical protein SFV55_20300 [Haliscomenobacter sp.]|uniref:hypothetical protein n=1 Tax=Haliscomenobacter sp. TaxID=2717303 RepID=UPI0029BF4C43|nr:hypothetical protein [Haliscomenobacter sp.]MDX2070782.1 hypothetical protein [Haliscomenobacter sp.]